MRKKVLKKRKRNAGMCQNLRTHLFQHTHVLGRAGCVGPYLSVGVLMVLVIAGVVVLLDEAKVLLTLPLQCALPPLGVGGEVALWERERAGGGEGENLCFCTGQLQHL